MIILSPVSHDACDHEGESDIKLLFGQGLGIQYDRRKVLGNLGNLDAWVTEDQLESSLRTVWIHAYETNPRRNHWPSSTRYLQGHLHDGADEAIEGRPGSTTVSTSRCSRTNTGSEL